jgi:hypothetical protein
LLNECFGIWSLDLVGWLSMAKGSQPPTAAFDFCFFVARGAPNAGIWGRQKGGCHQSRASPAK